MGKVTEILLKDFNDPIFDRSYEIYSPKRKVSTKSSQENTDLTTMKKPTKQEVDDLIKYCTDKDRTIPHHWVKVMEIIEYQKQTPTVQKSIKCLILGAWHYASKEDKVKVFHNQIKFAGLWSYNRDKVFYELKDFLTQIPEKEWFHQEL